MRGVQYILCFHTSCCYNNPLVFRSPCHSWNITLPHKCLIKWNCPSMQGAGLPSIPALKKGFPVARPSLFGGLRWKGWWERGCSFHCPVNFRLKDPAQSWDSVVIKMTIWWNHQLDAVLSATWLALGVIGCLLCQCLSHAAFTLLGGLFD